MGGHRILESQRYQLEFYKLTSQQIRVQVCCHFSVRLKNQKIILLFRSVLPKRILSLPSKKQKQKLSLKRPMQKTEDNKKTSQNTLTITKLKRRIMKWYYFSSS